MAMPGPELVRALRATARRLSAGAPYQWGHQGSCNCGQLAQTLTRLSGAEIHALALEKPGDCWAAGRDHCTASGHPIDRVVERVLAAGLSPRDLAELEQLSAPGVLARIPPGRLPLERSRRGDAALYMSAWADLVEEGLRQRGTPVFGAPSTAREPARAEARMGAAALV